MLSGLLVLKIVLRWSLVLAGHRTYLAWVTQSSTVSFSDTAYVVIKLSRCANNLVKCVVGCRLACSEGNKCSDDHDEDS